MSMSESSMMMAFPHRKRRLSTLTGKFLKLWVIPTLCSTHPIYNIAIKFGLLRAYPKIPLGTRQRYGPNFFNFIFYCWFTDWNLVVVCPRTVSHSEVRRWHSHFLFLHFAFFEKGICDLRMLLPC